MMLLFANHFSSGLVIISCWWLAHSNARSNPPGRAIAVGYSLIGFSILFTAVARDAGLDQLVTIPWMIVGTKLVLGITLGLTIMRRYQDDNRPT